MDDMPEDPFPHVHVETLNLADVALMIVVDNDGHMRYRGHADRSYAKYVLRAALEKLDEMDLNGD